MSELNREQIIKALECCGVGCELRSCTSECPYFSIPLEDTEDCCDVLARDALALIKELTEENERARSHIGRLKKYDEKRDVALHARLVAEARADTARKMEGLLNAQIDEITRSRIELRAFPFAALLAERMKVIVAETAKKVEEGSV